MDEATVRHVAALARLELADDEIARMAVDMSRITEFIARFAVLPIDNVDPTRHPCADDDLWRDDEVIPSLPRETAVQNAPDAEQGFFRVPPVIE